MGILHGSKDEFTTSTVAEIDGKQLKFFATFRRRDWDEAARIAGEISDALLNDAARGWDLMKSTIREDLVKWDKLHGDGGEVEYTAENLEQALAIYSYRHALYRGWTAAQMQQPSVNAKN